MEAQSLSVKRAEVEFHQFASLGEPDRAIAAYLEQNERRGAIIRKHLDYIGPITPFLEIGSNVGHSSYMLTNEFGADGYALDISADSLRYGKTLMQEWNLKREPVRIAGDALHLPFADGSLRLVMAFQMLSQFMDIEAVILEVKRVLAPGGVFLFAEEPIRRLLSLRLYRAPYEREMKDWERKLYQWGLLGYLTKDVIGAQQEESFGIRQNHTMTLWRWHELIRKHFTDYRHQLFVREAGWGERVVRQVGRQFDKLHSDWVPARLLGGTLAAICKKDGDAPMPAFSDFTSLLRCPECRGRLILRAGRELACAECAYTAADEDGVYNLLPGATKRELYPGDRPDIIDFSQAAHEDKLLEGFSGMEGVYGNKYRWIGGRATARLQRVSTGKQAIRVRGFATEAWLRQPTPRIRMMVNGQQAGLWTFDRTGLFILEAALPDAAEYVVELQASPVFEAPGDDRKLTVTISMLRLVPAG